MWNQLAPLGLVLDGRRQLGLFGGFLAALLLIAPIAGGRRADDAFASPRKTALAASIAALAAAGVPVGVLVAPVYGDLDVAVPHHQAGGHRWQRIPPTERNGRVHGERLEPPHVVIVELEHVARAIDSVFGTNIQECGGCKKRREALNRAFPGKP